MEHYINAQDLKIGQVIDHPGFRCKVSTVVYLQHTVVIRCNDDTMSLIFAPMDRVHMPD